jgi:hypothetical protein
LLLYKYVINTFMDTNIKYFIIFTILEDFQQLVIIFLDDYSLLH